MVLTTSKYQQSRFVIPYMSSMSNINGVVTNLKGDPINEKSPLDGYDGGAWFEPHPTLGKTTCIS